MLTKYAYSITILTSTTQQRDKKMKTQTTLDTQDFNSCVARAMILLENRKKQMESEGYIFNTCLKSCEWAIEQKIINRNPGATMMSAVIEYVESIEAREELHNNI